LSRGRGKSQSRLDRSTLRDDFIVWKFSGNKRGFL
jgi:hypothetical protein